jgi:(p)ppGpp synthase/HD superfamily hydrolase
MGGEAEAGLASVECARIFAIRSFGSYNRPGGRAYDEQIVHAQEVAELVAEAGGSKEEVVAAWLHDVVEDTDVELAIIRTQFGEAVAEIVSGLTDADDMSGLPTLKRKRRQAQKLREKGGRVKLPKLADQISNLRQIFHSPPSHWDNRKCLHYIRGARMVAEACKGVSPLLDGYFQEAYSKALSKYA